MPKRISKPRQVVSINLEKEIVDLVEQNRRDLTRSDKINSLIKSGLQYESRGQKRLYEYDWKDNYQTYTLKGACQKLQYALEKGIIQHKNGRWFKYGLEKMFEEACKIEGKPTKREDHPKGAAHTIPIPYGEI